ncbi:rCG53692 [Rattus norvegicus]|uniref:RCG53692 n=1 Tax=Rattus norvegicus TaxID=10116 RepID=A6JAH4_RAT|nr:rCG53692 [Rattus norvegicus]
MSSYFCSKESPFLDTHLAESQKPSFRQERLQSWPFGSRITSPFSGHCIPQDFAEQG